MQDESAYRLDIGFKGNRNYLHGTDLFDAMVALNGEASGSAISDIRMSFYRPITHRVEAVRARPGSAASSHPAAMFELKIDGAPVIWALQEKAGQAVEGRRPYDEDAVAAGSRVEDRAIAQAKPTPYTFIERVVALNKRLLDALQGGRKVSWWFARLELGRLPPAAPALRLGVETELGGRLVRSSIAVDGAPAGSIYFSEKKAA
jgi:hypothetical protein